MLSYSISKALLSIPRHVESKKYILKFSIFERHNSSTGHKNLGLKVKFNLLVLLLEHFWLDEVEWKQLELFAEAQENEPLQNMAQCRHQLKQTLSVHRFSTPYSTPFTQQSTYTSARDEKSFDVWRVRGENFWEKILVSHFLFFSLSVALFVLP